MTYFVYILECQNNAYYTGYTTDIKRRYQEHQYGSVKCKYTRSFAPRRLAVCWQIESTLSLVLKIEYRIKKLSREKKLQLVCDPSKLQKLLGKIDISQHKIKPLHL